MKPESVAIQMTTITQQFQSCRAVLVYIVDVSQRDWHFTNLSNS